VNLSVIPCYIERLTSREVIRLVQGSSFAKEILVLDDASINGTRDVLACLAYDNPLVLYQDCNQRKGAALRCGFAQVNGEVFLVQDADLEYNLIEQKRLHPEQAHCMLNRQPSS
jgi:glycosyltransferase involved in cell wall biosynthesis